MATESGGTYLPPVIASLVGTADDLAQTLIEAKAMIEDFSKTPTSVDIRAEITPLAQLQMELFRDIGGLQVLAQSAPIDLPLQLDMFQIITDAAVARETIVKTLNTPPVKADIGPNIDMAGFLTARAVIAAIFARIGVGAAGIAGVGGSFGRGGFFGPGGAFGTGGLGGALGFGQGAGLGGGGWMPQILPAGLPFLAGFGTIGGLMGFSIEHVLTTILGLIGSLSEAFAGLGVIAAGAFASMAVGMGSDMVVMRSTIADTKTLYTSWTNLQQAVMLYGASSTQAHAASQALNNQLKILGNTAGVQAELGLAKLAYTINQQFDRATSNARVQAVGLLTQILVLGQSYIPLVAGAAEQNLAIINTAIKPLFTWLEGPQGMGIFNHLEAVFKSDLPTAVDTFNKAIEFLLRFLDLASNYTSGFMQYLDRLFTYLNSSTGFARVERDVNNVVAVFKVWQAFIIILGKDLFLLLGQTVGVGTSIVQALTGMLTKLHDYLTSTSGKKSIGSLFEAHKKEILLLLELIPKLAGPLGQVYLALAVPLTQIAVAVLGIVNSLISLPGVGPIIAWGLAFLLLAQRMQLATLLMGAWNAIVKVATAVQWAFDLSLDANVIAIIILAIIALIVIIVLLVTHWKQVITVVQNVWKQVTHWVGQIVADVGKFFSNLGTMVEKAWTNFAARPGYWLGYLLGTLIGWAIRADLTFNRWFDGIIVKVISWGVNMAKQAPGALAAFLVSVFNELNKLPGQIITVGESIVKGLWQGIQNLGPWLLKQVSGFLHGLVTGALNALEGRSPSEKFARVGETIPQGIGLGVTRQSAVAMSALAAMFNRMTNQGQMLARGGNFGTPMLAFAGAGGGRGPISLNMPITVQVSGQSAATPQGIGTAVQQAVQKEFANLVQALEGGVYGNPGQG